VAVRSSFPCSIRATPLPVGGSALAHCVLTARGNRCGNLVAAARSTRQNHRWLMAWLPCYVQLPRRAVLATLAPILPAPAVQTSVLQERAELVVHCLFQRSLLRHRSLSCADWPTRRYRAP